MMPWWCTRRVLWPLTSLRRRVSYYDSQAGQHINYSEGVKVHGHAATDFVYSDLRRLTGLTSFQVPGVGEDVSQLSNEFTGPVFSSTPRDGLHLALDFNPSTPRLTWDTTIVSCANAKKNQQLVKINLVGAGELDPIKVQLAASLFADAGCDYFFICTPGDVESSELLEELWEALVGCDVAGVPMKQRLGLRLLCQEAPDEVMETLKKIGVANFDCCLRGGPAISPESLHQAMTKATIISPLQFTSHR